MSILEGMKEIRADGPDMFLSLNATGATVSSAVIKALGDPEGIRIFADKDIRRIALVVGTADDYKLDKHMTATSSLSLRGFYITRHIHEAAGFTPGEGSFKVPGQFVKEENLVFFDCNDKIPMRTRVKKSDTEA